MDEKRKQELIQLENMEKTAYRAGAASQFGIVAGIVCGCVAGAVYGTQAGLEVGAAAAVVVTWAVYKLICSQDRRFQQKMDEERVLRGFRVKRFWGRQFKR